MQPGRSRDVTSRFGVLVGSFVRALGGRRSPPAPFRARCQDGGLPVASDEGPCVMASPNVQHIYIYSTLVLEVCKHWSPNWPQIRPYKLNSYFARFFFFLLLSPGHNFSIASCLLIFDVPLWNFSALAAGFKCNIGRYLKIALIQYTEYTVTINISFAG